MLQIVVLKTELWDESKLEFIYVPEQTFDLEHSLVSLSKWESKWKKPFLVKGTKTPDETMDYVRCMTLTPNILPEVYYGINPRDIQKIMSYVEDPMTATTFGKDPTKVSNKETITSEIIYYWMVALNIPFECETWHLNRLLTLINVCNIKNQPAKKMGQKEIIAQQRALNEARRKSLGIKG